MSLWDDAIEFDRSALYSYQLRIIPHAENLSDKFPPVSYRALTNVLDTVARALEDEATEVTRALGLQEDATPLLRRAQRFFFPNRKILIIGGVRQSSIVIEAFVIGGLFYYVLDKTFGTSISEAYKTTATHERLKHILTADVGKTVSQISERAAHYLRRKRTAIRSSFEGPTRDERGKVLSQLNIYLPPEDIQ